MLLPMPSRFYFDGILLVAPSVTYFTGTLAGTTDSYKERDSSVGWRALAVGT